MTVPQVLLWAAVSAHTDAAQMQARTGTTLKCLRAAYRDGRYQNFGDLSYKIADIPIHVLDAEHGVQRNGKFCCVEVRHSRGSSGVRALNEGLPGGLPSIAAG